MSDLADELGVEGAAALPHVDASAYVNDANIELAWAVKCYEHAETYFKLLSAVEPSNLRLTSQDKEIRDEFAKRFGDLKIDKINEDELKSKDSKAKWREFCNLFEKSVEEFNFGTLLRLDSSKGYSEENTTIVPRVQFYAIELARNKQGLNDCHYKKA
ncbi:protein PBDC1-like [Oscarella lobularis]|uniref:protein PBDC1-like n=1 Tax=Oscarella lobularis TaxID=121494 RepID=UPI0033142B89